MHNNSDQLSPELSSFKESFYRSLNNLILNERHKKVISKLLESYPEEFTGGLTNKKYVSMTRISPETAKRDLKTLLEYGILIKNEAKGRSTSYRLNVDFGR